ncbi:MAG: hypothetical protein IJM30_10435 [Thermoguttaceae bacterium]|nr:hypothetical protein [Thermoguttaceae bacterium]
MKKELVKRATLGDSSTPWETLLAAGTEALREIGTKLPKPKANPDSILFCEPDEGDALTEEQADFFLAEHHESATIATGKRFPASRIERLMNYMSYWSLVNFFMPDKLRRLCGNAGLFLALVSRNDEWKRSLSRYELMYYSLDPETFVRETTRVATGNAEYEFRYGALKAIRNRGPNRGREIFERLWDDESISKKKRSDLRRGMIDVLDKGIGAEDIPLLEKALESEDKALVQLATHRLATIPSSRVYRDLLALGKDALTLDGRLVSPAYSKALERLGVANYKAEGVSTGVALLEATPLCCWEELFDASPEKIAESIPFSPETEAIYAGWILSFINYTIESDSFLAYYNFDAASTPVKWARVLEPALLALEYGELADKTLEAFLTDPKDNDDSRTETFHYYALHVASRAELEFELKKTERTIKNPRKRELEMFSLRVEREPKPWSDEFCDEYYRIALESGPVPHEFESTFAGNIGFFSRPMREKILAELKKNPDASKRRKSSISIAEYQASRADDVERIIGDYRLVD